MELIPIHSHIESPDPAVSSWIESQPMSQEATLYVFIFSICISLRVCLSVSLSVSLSLFLP